MRTHVCVVVGCDGGDVAPVISPVPAAAIDVCVKVSLRPQPHTHLLICLLHKLLLFGLQISDCFFNL